MKREDLSVTQKNKLVAKVHEMLLGELDHAVLMPDFRSQAIATLGARRGGLGEVTRTVAMYKSFPILMMMKQLYRGAAQHGLGNKMSYIAQLSIGLMVMGAIALQAKELARGKNPRDMTDPKFWAAAHLQGGGLGIFGDFLHSNQSRFGSSFTKTLVGPGFGLLDDITKLTLGNLQQLVAGKDTNISADMIQFMRRYTPGTSVWYLRALYERTILDQLQKILDPKAYKKFRNQMKRRERDYGQSYWWKPGSVVPESVPDLTEAVGG